MAKNVLCMVTNPMHDRDRDTNPFYRDVVVDDEAIARLPVDTTVERELAVLEDDEVPPAGDRVGAASEEIVGPELVVKYPKGHHVSFGEA